MTRISGHPAKTADPVAPIPARLGPGDLAGLAIVGLRTRKLRAGLSALGIAIGVAAIVAVLGLAASSQAALLNEISQLGTNLLTVTNGQTLGGDTAELPEAAPGMITRLPGVAGVQNTGTVGGVDVYKSPLIPSIETSGLSVDAATLGLPAVAGTSLAQGRYLNAATEREPVAVLGAAAAQLLGIDRIQPGMRIWADGQWIYVTGILNHAVLAPEIDTEVLIGFPAAEQYLHFDGHPSEIYVRTVNTPAATTAVDNLLGYQADPEHPNQVNVSQPSSALTATSWSSPSWNAAPRSGCAAPLAPPKARSASSSWPRPSCCPWPAAPPPPPSTPAATASSSSSRPKPGPEGSPPPSSSAPWPGCCPPSAPPVYPPPKPSGPCEEGGSASRTYRAAPPASGTQGWARGIGIDMHTS